MTELQIGEDVLLIPKAWTRFFYKGWLMKRSEKGNWSFWRFIGEIEAKTS